MTVGLKILSSLGPMKREFIVTSEYSDRRIDSFLSDMNEDKSRSWIQKLFPEGRVLVNDNRCTSKKYIVKTGDTIAIELEDNDCEDNTNGIKALPKGEPISLDIVFEDDYYLVINKPKGLVVHPGNGNETGTLVNGLINYLGNSFLSEVEEVCDVERPGIVHRIDKDTTGLIVVAKRRESFISLSEQFRDHSITRRYTALVYNNFGEDEGVIDEPIGRDPRNRLRRKVNGIEPRKAVTHYKVIERLGIYNLIEASLETGRTHQIRVHMSYIGHPVVGDPVYGPRKDSLNAGGQMLHAGVLGFVTINGEYVEFSRDLPDRFKAVLKKIRINKG